MIKQKDILRKRLQEAIVHQASLIDYAENVIKAHENLARISKLGMYQVISTHLSGTLTSDQIRTEVESLITNEFGWSKAAYEVAKKYGIVRF